MSKNILLGIDPGTQTGAATFIDGRLHSIDTITQQALLDLLVNGTINGAVTGVVYEDSSKQKHVWHRTGLHPAAMLKVARNVGMVDEMCRNIARVCKEQGIPSLGVSPLAKGAKLDAVAFMQRTGWQLRTSQHGRDAAMVAWGYRSYKATSFMALAG